MTRDPVAEALAEPVEVVDYDPAWPAAFEAEAARLRALLGPRIGRIAHFGSTAVPGLAAKPIIDIMVAVPRLADVHETIAPILTRAGYDYFWRPVSPGDPDIAYAWFIRRDGSGRRSHHIHLAEEGSPDWDRLRFRDLLRADAALRERYAALKRALAARCGQDRRAYAAGKADFIAAAMAGTD